MHFHPLDSGPIYAETRLYDGAGLVEPWNVWSNLLFFVIVLFWAWRVLKRPTPVFFLIASPILFIGWLGGTLYHGLRNNEVWYWMDFLPIYLLAGMMALLCWRRVLPARWRAVGTGVFFLPVMMQHWFQSPGPMMIFTGYVSLAFAILTPISIESWVRSNAHSKWILAAAISFAIAIFFRQSDLYWSTWLSHGTHFLWHTFGAISVLLLSEWFYLVNVETASST